MKRVRERIEALRVVMQREGIGACIFPSTDPHCGEYVPDHWKSREYISGFDGSAGTAVVTLHEAALWTDSRYFLAAEEALKGTEFVLMKEKVVGTPTIAQWIGQKLSVTTYTEVAIDGMVCSATEVIALQQELREQGGLTLRTNLDPLKEIWVDRPPLPSDPITIHPLAFAGEESKAKIARIRQALREQHACGIFVSTLDDIAWTLNLRGSDVYCTPVFIAYMLITLEEVILYIDNRKVSDEVSTYLRNNKVTLKEYNAAQHDLRTYSEYNILVDGSSTCYTLYNSISAIKVDRPSPVPYMKAIKNETEIEGFRKAMVRDGVAMVKFLYWLDNAQVETLTELSVSKKLYDLRATQPLFKDISFDTIAAYGPHGAIVHYEPTEESDIALEPHGFLLLDSGAQYEDGTTDITRTIPLGPLTDEERRIYTLVLKGHIDLQMLTFPDGASGTQIDAIARAPLWKDGLNFLHGTGHGVGSFLSVHEGSHQIRMEWKPAKLHAGMTVTDEPGIYLAGRFGVRIENTLLIVPAQSEQFAKSDFDFLQFEPLTLCPIDMRPVIPNLLTEEERAWLHCYHQKVYDRLSPFLTPQESAWLIGLKSY